MEMIKHLQIKNYKSIKQLDLDCSRINVFVGRPNVGKSNILEALALDQLSSFLFQNASIEKNKITSAAKIDLKNIFRVETARNLFHFHETDKPIELTMDLSLGSFGDYPRLKIEHVQGEDIFLWKREGVNSVTAFTQAFEPVIGKVVVDTMTKRTINSDIGYASKINHYNFNNRVYQEKLFHNEGGYMHLLPPYGNNILSIIERIPSLREKIADIFHDTGFDFVIDQAENKLRIQCKRKGVIFSVPFISIADTLQRLIFYLCAIESNQHGNGRILLEEPEVHSFPSFVSYLADEIIESNNQFFIVTHSPYLLNELIENAPAGDTSVFVCDYAVHSFQTTAKKLTNEDISELLDYGVDIFFNINRYLDDRIEHNT